MDIDALLHAQDLLFYDTFPDAVPKPSDTDVQVAHINAYCPPESQPLLAYAAEYVYPNPVDSWAFYQPDLICPPRLALDLPTYDDYPFPPSATTPVSPYATFDDPSQSPPSSAVSTHSSVSVFADGSEPSTEGFCESPTAIMGPPPLDDLVPIARKRDDIVRRPVKTPQLFETVSLRASCLDLCSQARYQQGQGQGQKAPARVSLLSRSQDRLWTPVEGLGNGYGCVQV
ncbi:hypothetical protein C8F01DRAFT_1180905, partial [Mycena amicta]